jgi:hypothetical protein
LKATAVDHLNATDKKGRSALSWKLYASMLSERRREEVAELTDYRAADDPEVLSLLKSKIIEFHRSIALVIQELAKTI